MPSVSEKQKKAAGAELGRRKEGAGKSKSRPFGTAKTKDLKDFASKPVKKKK